MAKTEKFDGRQGGGKPKPKSAYALAQEILADDRFLQNKLGQVYRWTGAYWERLTKPTLEAIALRYDDPGMSRIEKRREVVATIAALTHQSEFQWGRVAPHEVGCSNGVVDVLTGKVRKHRPEDYLENVIPHDFDPGAEAPLWLDALDLWFGDDQLAIDALQEFFGYVLMSHARFKKALMLVGPTGTGKSQVAEAASQLVGRSLTCQLGVQDMDDPVLRSVLKGKRLNVMTELSARAMIADGGFKTLVSTEEPVLINEKYEPAELYVPTAKHLIATNNPPQIRDRTGATLRRLLILPMQRPIAPERELRDFQERLGREVQGLLAWAIDGARRLVEKRGEFTEPDSSRDALDEYAAEINPFVAFAKEQLEAAEGEVLPLSIVLPRFNRWNGGRSTAAREFGRMVRDAGFTVKQARHNGRSAKCITDVALAPEEQPEHGTRAPWKLDEEGGA